VTRLETYVVEVDVTGMPAEDLGGLHRALTTAVARLRVAGEQVEYRGGLRLVGEDNWFGVFAAADPEVVRRIARMVQVTGATVRRAVAFQPAAP
jgi:hypothetical protein